MRLSLITDEMDQDLGRVITRLAGTNVRGLEIRSMWDTPPHRLTTEQLDRIRDALALNGYANAGFCSAVGKCLAPANEFEEEFLIHELRTALIQANRLSAPHVRVFTFLRAGSPDPVGAAHVWRRLLGSVSADQVRIAFETGTRSNTPTLNHMSIFLQELEHTGVGILWDPGNTAFSGFDSVPFPRDYETARGRISHVHVKDPSACGEYVRLGTGMLPWKAILERLAYDGYLGWISLETHWRMDRVLSPEERDEPWGNRFSQGGWDATLQCLEILTRF